jgi:hypothetical protein
MKLDHPNAPMGHQRIMIPADVNEGEIFHSVRLCRRHVTLFLRVSAAGDTLDLTIICATAINELFWLNGWTEMPW